MVKMIEVEIDSVRVSLTNQQRVVILKQTNADRFLPILIGLYEAEAITIALQEIEVARPQTHDLLATIIKSLNGRAIQIEVISLSDDIFYGNIILEIEGVQRRIDCRPSDALALAARLGIPIMVSEDVMEQAGIIPERDISDRDSEKQETFEGDFDEKDLGIFEDFLKNIDLDDLNSEEGSEPEGDNE
jgi:bifunctional DNase/RNase